MNGKRIGILESRLGSQMAELIARRGGVPVHAPSLSEIPDIDRDFIARMVAEMESRPIHLAIFQTGVGTQALFKTTDSLGLTDVLLGHLAVAKVLARGPKPTGILRARNVRIDLSPADPYTTVEILDLLRSVELAGKRALVQRYGVTNRELEDALKAAGAEVVEIPTYRWSLPEDTRPMVALMDALDKSEIDAVAFTNAAQIYNLFELAELLGRAASLPAALNRTLVASIGPVCSETLRKFGLTVGLEASPPKLGPFLSALDTALKA
jgi:uroporphyrinogen-III synthase